MFKKKKMLALFSVNKFAYFVGLLIVMIEKKQGKLFNESTIFIFGK